MGMFSPDEQVCIECTYGEHLTPEEAHMALKDLSNLFMYLSNHGFATPIPSIVRLVNHLQTLADRYICPECKNAARQYGYCSHCGAHGGLPPAE